jgi:hypothetical protein
LFLVPSGMVDLVNDDALAYSLTLHGADPQKARAAYGLARPAGEVLLGALSDWFFRLPAIRVAEARAQHGAATLSTNTGAKERSATSPAGTSSTHTGGRTGSIRSWHVAWRRKPTRR